MFGYFDFIPFWCRANTKNGCVSEIQNMYSTFSGRWLKAENLRDVNSWWWILILSNSFENDMLSWISGAKLKKRRNIFSIALPSYMKITWVPWRGIVLKITQCFDTALKHFVDNLVFFWRIPTKNRMNRIEELLRELILARTNIGEQQKSLKVFIFGEGEKIFNLGEN